MADVMVSIICTSYNYAQYLPQALDSFLAQETTFPYEIIVVDDCSTDQSREVLTDYASKHPDLIRLFFNDSNLGITKTWVAICQEARGKYIARCDADDYWLDSLKLQKQVDLLEAVPQSKWCNTDFHIVDEYGNIVYEHVFINGPIDYANTYAKMLATKGMTLPSSWLVETRLMQMVNATIDPNAVDDTFNIQLELFQHIEPLFLPEATVAYRMTQNSDSRPTDREKIRYRVEGLKKTQLEYLEKYPDKDILEIARLQVEREAWQEMRAFEQADMIAYRDQDILNLKEQLLNAETECQRLTDQYGILLGKYNRVITSRRWAIPSRIIALLKGQSGED
ncbi:MULTISPECIES: glycosyltransferase family 2 protein [unclassified Streptococcus]|uniref:glycosyltransferase family 2 protein n=1 Tax=unclassified Streptococcus TaxID=2608887 RepID=UPI00359DF560